jgi:flagellar biosynthesis chaperone FliJ
MPYRRLPNTDTARLKSLKSAYERGMDLPPFQLAFSPSSYRKIQSVLPGFENAISEHRNALNLQSEKNKEYQKRLRKARLYISHFIQVVNMAISRGDLLEETREYFGLEDGEKKVPSLNSEEEVIHWGSQLIEGEQKRRSRGLSPITNPTIAVMKVHYDKFLEYHNYQSSLKSRSQRAQDELNKHRNQVDGVIQQIWNEVEDTYNDLPEEMRREKASEYGLVYVFRKNELTNANPFQSPRIEEIG